MPETPIDFSRYLVPRGVQPGEHPLPDETTSGSAPSLPPLNESASQQIQEMGFSAVQAEKALRMTGNTSAEVAMQWLFEHIDDEDLNVPFQTPGQGAAGAGGSVAEVDQGKMEDLMGMGFDEHMAKRALQETVPPPSKPSIYEVCAVGHGLTGFLGRKYGTCRGLVILTPIGTSSRRRARRLRFQRQRGFHPRHIDRKTRWLFHSRVVYFTERGDAQGE